MRLEFGPTMYARPMKAFIPTAFAQQREFTSHCRGRWCAMTSPLLFRSRSTNEASLSCHGSQITTEHTNTHTWVLPTRTSWVESTNRSAPKTTLTTCSQHSMLQSIPTSHAMTSQQCGLVCVHSYATPMAQLRRVKRATSRASTRYVSLTPA